MYAMIVIVASGIGLGLFGNIDLPNMFKQTLPPMVIYRYDKTVESHKDIGPTDKEYKIISNFLKENEDGWVDDARSYAPIIVLKAPDYSINCMSDGVVINYKNTKGRWKQISKSYKIPFCGLSQEIIY